MKAMGLIEEIFKVCHSEWRGLGIIENSGLKIREQYKEFDVEEVIQIEVEEVEEKTEECICSEILKGLKIPIHCSLFGRICTPEHPKGPCMVSSEGTCAAYYKYPSTGGS